MNKPRRQSGSWCRSRTAGLILMLAGLIIMMLIVPRWAWAGIICAVMILGGFILWRYC
ncbi:MAG: hypothetical protein IJC56_02810 [Clostridia bacterium]|nr:hypothetical protein [Clostridia bacterium]